MDFDWRTFAIEIANFLLLAWLLQHFLYRPVLAAVARRRAAQQQSEQAARALQDEARALKSRYEASLGELAVTRATELEALGADIAELRQARQAALDAEFAAERERRERNAARRDEDRAMQRERQAVELAAAFAARLLARLADAALERRLVELALSDLEGLDDARRSALRAALAPPPAAVQVSSAYPLDDAQRAALGAALGRLAGHAFTPTFVQAPELVAGLRIAVGDWVMMANLRDELRYFASAPEHGA